MSYAAFKQWILIGRIPTIKTPGGHHRIRVDALDDFLSPLMVKSDGSLFSGCNRLAGTVVEVTVEGLVGKVVLSVGQGQRVTAIITADAVRELGLKPGDKAVALINATQVMIGEAEKRSEAFDFTQLSQQVEAIEDGG